MKNNYTAKHKEDILNAVSDILDKGNDVEIKSCKDGIKVIEVKRQVHSKIEGEEFKPCGVTIDTNLTKNDILKTLERAEYSAKIK